jgi:hypothetical protein
MVFNKDYEFGMSPNQIKRKWPSLIVNNNFNFTSEKTWDYNCVAWATRDNSDWIQFEYDHNGDLIPDSTLELYIDFFKNKGFEICNDSSLESGFEKICIYADSNNKFTHVALQLSNGIWASKMGNYEDIEHTNTDCLIGDFYGQPKIFMKKTK